MRELLQQALDALINGRRVRDCEGGTSYQPDLEDAAITALREALAAPMPEPVAWGMFRADGLILDVITPEEHESYAGEYTVPLYAAPPAAPADSQPRTTKPVVSQKAANLPDNADMVMVPREPTQAMCAAAVVFANGNAVYKNVLSEVLKLEESIYAEVYEAMIAAAPAPATSADYAMGYAEGFNDACKPAPVVREPIIDEMDAVASRYAHKLALDLECVLSDYNGKWWDTAMQTIGEYRMAMNRIHERESPTHMGEPVLPKISSGVGK